MNPELEERAATLEAKIERAEREWTAVLEENARLRAVADKSAVEITSQQLSVLLLCSARYALGRRTYIVSEVCGLVRSLGRNADAHTLGIIARDIREERDRGERIPRLKTLGDDCDARDWLSLLEWLEAQHE